MHYLIIFLAIVGGGVLLTYGANILVDNSSKLAQSWKISPIVVGLTIVAFGTSAPEFTVNVLSSVQGHPEIAMGNIVGSNIFNILIILGICALIKPLSIPKEIVKKDMPLLLLFTLLTWFWIQDNVLSFWEGFIFVSVLFYYTFYLIIDSRNNIETHEIPKNLPPQTLLMFWVFFGLVLLVSGAKVFLYGAVEIANIFQVPKSVIALTIIAVGTSLPELAASLIATIKGEKEIAIGNVIGSNIFNLLGALGTSALVSPSGLPVELSMKSVDAKVMFATTALTMPLFIYRPFLSRIVGVVFVFLYVLYTYYLYLLSVKPEEISSYSNVVMSYFLPIAVIILFAEAISNKVRHIHSRKK